MNSNNNAMVSYLKKNLLYILAFIVPACIILGIFIAREVYPFGEMMYLRSDCYHQYAPFYKELYRKLTSGGSLTYSWEIGMGLNFTSIIAYYLASPSNLLIFLVANEDNVIEFMMVTYVVKIALSCTFTTYYLSKHFNTKSYTTLAFGLFYGFSSYYAAFSWNIMWLDTLMLLPLVVLGLEKLVKEGKISLYVVTLALSVYSNYYIAIMVCLFMVIYFVYLLFIDTRIKDYIFIGKKFVRFALSSLIAGLFGFVLILPELYTLGLSYSSDIDFPTTLTRYFSILYMLSRNVMEMYASVFDAHSPNIYFSVCSYLFIPLYFFVSSASRREKLGKAAMVILFLFSFNLNIPNYIWHGLHYPNSLPARESFIMIFLMITMCFEAFRNIRSCTYKQIFGCFAASIALLLIIEELYVGTSVFDDTSNNYDYNFIYISMLFIVFYLVIALLAKRPRVRKAFVIYLLIIISIAEVAINTDATGYSCANRTYYLEDNDSIQTMLAQLEEESSELFYRTERLDRKTKNDAAWIGYYGVSTFSSTANESITEVLGRLGFERSANAYSALGWTPVTAALLNVKYLIASSSTKDLCYASLVKADDDNSRYIYENAYYLPLGFMLDENFLEEFDVITLNNPFAVQNDFISAATGGKYSDVFLPVGATDNGSYAEINVTEATHIYVYVTNYVDSVTVTATSSSDITYSFSQTFSGTNHRYVLDIGEVPADTVITVTPGETVSSCQIYAYSYDEDVWNEIYADLADETMEITEFEDTYIKGTVTASEDGYLYTSINYDAGWSVYVDGKEVELESVYGAFLGVYVSAGTHTVEFKYRPVGFIPGLILTTISFICMVLIVIYEIRKKKRRIKLGLPESDDDEEVYPSIFGYIRDNCKCKKEKTLTLDEVLALQKEEKKEEEGNKEETEDSEENSEEDSDGDLSEEVYAGDIITPDDDDFPDPGYNPDEVKPDTKEESVADEDTFLNNDIF